MSVNPGQYPPEATQQQQYYEGGGTTGGGGGMPSIGRRGSGRHGHGSKPFFLTSEFLVLVACAVAILIAAAIAENFGAARAWTLVTVLAAAYIISRGLAKSGGGSDSRT